MSLEATHIRFANDIKHHYEINDFSAYISGSIYPDSRYITETDRILTHEEENINKNSISPSFKAGWQAHYICDKAFGEARKIIFPEIPFKELSAADDWIISTVIKILQDIDDVKFLKREYLDCLNYVEAPHNESIPLLIKYNSIVKDFYEHGENLVIDNYRKLWLSWGVAEGLVEKLIIETKKFSLDEQFFLKTKLMYKKMLELV